MAEQRVVLFFRDFRKFQGGHLKVFDYFEHVRSSPEYEARVRFSERSVWDERNPWRDLRETALAPGQACRPDVLFLGGTDWRNLSEAERERPPAPVINFIQHVRHAAPDDPRHPFLRHRAVRICCSEEAAEAIRATGQVNGPIFAIPYGLDAGAFPPRLPRAERDIDILVVAIKQPALGRRLRWRLWRPGRRVRLLAEPVLRRDFLSLLSRSRVTVFLPHETEGFYIPALEGMGAETLVVCPDCIGNRSFCVPGSNAFRPAFSPREIRRAAEAALALSDAQAERVLAAARETFARHDLARERRQFLQILADVERLA